MPKEATILLVEDNQDDIDLTLRAFHKSKIANRIAVARDGQEALDYVFAAAANLRHDPDAMPQVVLLDLKLPKLSGLDVLRALRSDERTRRLPVVVLTSSKHERDIVESYDLGANSYVRKPVDFAEFIEAARHLGLYWLVLNETAPLTRDPGGTP
jgi:two-component system response regulator